MKQFKDKMDVLVFNVATQVIQKVYMQFDVDNDKIQYLF